jgi:hypothetical protein
MLQNIEGSVTSLTLFITQSSGQEDLYMISFQDEEECHVKLQEMATLLSKNPPHKIAYSIEDSPFFMEKQWEEFLFSITQDSSFDLDSTAEYLSSTSFSSFPIMQGWGSSISDAQAQTKEAEPFFALRLTAKDKKNIDLLLTDLADKTYLQLLANQASMNRKGNRAKIVHPMRFIGYILSESYLHKCLKTIEKDSIKYKEFINGFENHMKEEAAKEDLLLYAPGFAELLGVDLQAVIEIIKSKNYANLIKKFL